MNSLSTAGASPFSQNRILQILCILLIVWTGYTAATAQQSFDYWLESALAMFFIGILTQTYRSLKLSNYSYLLIFVFLCLHQWGAQHKYADVPAGEWLKTLLGTQRNHYDRMMHFAYGLLLAYPMQEWFVRSAGAQGWFRYFLPIQFTLACSAVYELLEAAMAGILSPQRGEEFVGMQGDMWDAQKDMFWAGLGAVLAMSALAAIRARRRVARTSSVRADNPLYAIRSLIANK
ncbi:MAG: DUF2238 domain-containing protein [Acidobacteriota bacterium]